MLGVALLLKRKRCCDPRVVCGELGRQSWAPTALINAIVKDGIVELWGTITDERERQAMMVAAENVPGVRAVRDRLVWIEPTTGMAIYSSNDDPALAKAS